MDKQMKFVYVSQRAGLCPRCGEMGVNYSSPNYAGDNLTLWPFKCSKCGAEGFEEHVSKYLGTVIEGEGGSEYFDEGVEIEIKQPSK
jgi:ribosomal protein S27AE